MNTSNPWDHLPNAKHIDRIVTSYRRYQDIWDSAYDKWDNLVGYKLRVRAWNEARAKCKELDRWNILTTFPYYTPILVLIAYDDCAHYLEYTSQELTTIALLGVTPAILLLPVVIAFEEVAKISA